MAITPWPVLAQVAIKARELAAQEAADAEPPKPIWEPQHRKDCAGGDVCRCPQVLAYNCEADIIGYGGAAGGGKTDLALGLAGTKHRRSIILRRTFPNTEGIIARSREIFAQGENRAKDRFNESLHRWEIDDGGTLRSIRFGAMQYEDDKKNYHGRPYDLYVFDEATEFTETQVRYATIWNRSTVKGQKCRVVLPFNPPTPDKKGDLVGDWVVGYFGPWLDEKHPKPAKDGEIRWYVTIDSKDVEVDSGDDFLHTDNSGKTRIIKPRSRTFFHASLSDNPILEETGYDAVIDALPEELRLIFRGSFNVKGVSNPWQVIPTEWVKMAQARWQPEAPGPMTAIGSDLARGGSDKMTIARVHGHWFAELVKIPGAKVPDGPSAAGLIIAARQGNPVVCVDIIGIGSSGYDTLCLSGLPTIGVNFGEGSTLTDKSGLLRFANKRAECYWKFREALDPANGGDIALPPDPELLADLCAPRWSAPMGKIKIEAKDDIKKRIGRSPDCGDAVVYGYYGVYNGGPLVMESADPTPQDIMSLFSEDYD